MDANSDGFVSPLDVLVLIEKLNSTDVYEYPASYDIDKDGRLTTLDVLLVINHLNQPFDFLPIFPIITLAFFDFDNDGVFDSNIYGFSHERKVVLVFRGVFGKLIAAEIRAALPMADNQKIQQDISFAQGLLGAGSFMMRDAGGGVKIGDAIQSGVDAGIENAARVISETGESTRTTEARAGLNEITASLKASADALQKKTAESTQLNEAQARGIVSPGVGETATTAMKSAMGTLTTSQGRVGGGGFGMTFSGLAAIGQKTVRTLDKIEKNTRERNTSNPIPVVA
jgi:hypothetical protein